jgi:hypothetical protein
VSSTQSSHCVQQLSVQANKKLPVNTVGRRTRGSHFKKHSGVSLEMLAQSGMIGADLDDPNCLKFITDLVECQADVVEFVQSLPELLQRVLVCRMQLQVAAQAGHLNGFGEANTLHLIDVFNALVYGLDVHSVCPFLAQEHAPGNVQS